MESGAVLTRFETGDQGTFGDFRVLGARFFSGELPMRDNKPNISAIPPTQPPGFYRLRWTWSERFRRWMYLIEPVKLRAGIRCHSANLMGDVAKGYKSQLNGCVSLGEKLGWIDRQKAVLLSAPAVRRFEALMARRTLPLQIVNGWEK